MVSISSEYIVEKFVFHCEEMYPEDHFAYKYSSRKYESYGFREYFSDELLSSSGGDWIESIVRLTYTPRALKHVLRLCLASWKILHGEISLKHLVIAHTLQVCAPEAFQFVFEHIGDLRSIGRKGYEKSHEIKRDKLREKFVSLISSVDWNVSAAEFLVSEIFPGWNSPGSDLQGDIQGFQFSSPSDYWERFISCGIKEGEVTDQQIFKMHSDLLGYINGGCACDSVLDLMVKDKEIAERYEVLIAGRLEDVTSLSIFEEIIRYVIDIKYHPSSAHDIACFIPLWRSQIYGGRTLDEDVYGKRVFGLVSRSALYDLRLANDIFYYWRSRDSGDRGREVFWWNDFVRFVRDKFISNPSSFSKLLDPNFPYSCYHFSVLFSQERYGGNGFRLKEWTWFFDLILRAAEVAPTVVLPHIAGFLVQRADRFDSKIEYVYVDGGLDKYWPDNVGRLQAVFSLDVQVDVYSPEVSAMVNAARDKIVS